MKKFCMALLLMAGLVGTVAAQEKKWEHGVQLSAGVLTDQEGTDFDYGLSVKLGYSVAHRFTEQFSLKTGAAIRRDMEHAFRHLDGGYSDEFSYVEVPVIARWHMDDGFVFAVGPVLNILVDGTNPVDYYDIIFCEHVRALDALKPLYVGLQPSVMYEWGKHVRVGVEANVGLMNIRKFPDLYSEQYLRQVMLTVGYSF